MSGVEEALFSHATLPVTDLHLYFPIQEPDSPAVVTTMCPPLLC